MPNQTTERDLLQAHGAGKGDKDRSPGWRENMEAIDFHRDQPDGFTRTSATRIVKRYGGAP
jgi:hypothetical protein